MHLVGYNVQLDKLLKTCIGISQEYAGSPKVCATTEDIVKPQAQKELPSPLQQGDTHVANQDYATAIKLYTQALRELSKEARGGDSASVSLALNARAMCYLNLQKYQKALTDLNCIISLDPSCRDAYHTRANVFLAMNNEQAAALDCMRLCEIDTKLASEKTQQHQQQHQKQQQLCNNNEKEIVKALPFFNTRIVNTAIVILSLSFALLCVCISIFR